MTSAITLCIMIEHWDAEATTILGRLCYCLLGHERANTFQIDIEILMIFQMFITFCY